MSERKTKEVSAARNFYFSLPEKIYCPALKSHVQRSRVAWDHLVQKKARTKSQTYYRSKVVYHIQNILENSNFYQSHRVEGFCEFWSFQAVVEDICCELVVRKCGGQAMQLYSFVYKGGTLKNQKR